MTQTYKRLQSKRRRQNYKHRVIQDIKDYTNAINDTNIIHIQDMLNNIYDVTGWQPTTIKGYIKCAKYENNMKHTNSSLWFIPNEIENKEYLNINLNVL